MRYSKPIDSCLHALLNMTFPAAQAAGLVSALPGLSGNSWRIFYQGQNCVVRTTSDDSPGCLLHRHYRALQRKASDTGPNPLLLRPGWMLHSWLDGEQAAVIDSQALASLLHRVHSGRLFGWRIALLPALEQYWQGADPRRRTRHWHRQLQQLRSVGEPPVFRLAPLHMDVHAGNLIQGPAGLRLLDWEYAGDGDIALELASLSLPAEQMAALTAHYARLCHTDSLQLNAAIKRWVPWVQILTASWYERRWHQTGEQHFIHLAEAAWQPLR